MTDRDELLRQIGEKVVGITDEDGFFDKLDENPRQYLWTCPYCRRGTWEGHADDCALTRYLEATDE